MEILDKYSLNHYTTKILRLNFIFRLPFPWLLYTIVFQTPITVSAKGMVCSIAILFMMLILVFMSILIFNWKMTKGMGFSMFIFYFLFVLVSLGFEKKYYECPL